MKLTEKAALITGGNSGIGLATARLFAAEGARVAIVGRNQATLATALDQLGPDAIALTADTADEAALKAAIDQAAERFGGLDVVFANAGIGGQTPLGETTADRFTQVLDVNVTGVFLTVQASLPHLRNGASVILNGSVHAVMGMPGWAAYAASKAGVRALTRVLAAELAPRGIRVNQVTPGGSNTPIWSAVTATTGGAEALAARAARSVPFGRFSEPEEVAAAVLFLASDDASMVTATEIVVDGGVTGAPAGAPALLSPSGG
jgi:NAD(P)-dependent dehydrogenase (short-subunit alcohol dehydrogenase family)